MAKPVSRIIEKEAGYHWVVVETSGPKENRVVHLVGWEELEYFRSRIEAKKQQDARLNINTVTPTLDAREATA